MSRTTGTAPDTLTPPDATAGRAPAAEEGTSAGADTSAGPGTPDRTGAEAGVATYVFAVGRGCDAAALTGLPGHAPGTPLRLLPFGELTAVVQDVPAAAFTEDALRERLADRVELERCARAHHEVIAAAAAGAPTLPLPLATLYRGDARARAALRRDEPRFLAALERVAGRVEWGVKVHARPAAAREAPRPGAATAPAAREPDGAAGAGARPGHAYMQRLRGARQERERRQEAGLNAAEAVDRALRGIAVASRRLRAHDPALSGRGPQLLNAAYLVAEGREAEVREAVRRLRESPGCRAVEVELTGPWVPYSFVDGGGQDARG